MAVVLNKTTKQILRSVNTPDYSTEEWIINPVLPECPKKFWKIVGDSVVEMSAEEKQSVLDAENALILAGVESAKQLDNHPDKILKALALVVFDEINLLRDRASMTQRTPEQFKDAIKTKYENI